MKLNAKQIAYRNKIYQAFANKMRLRLLGFVMLVFTAMAGTVFASNPSEDSFNDLMKVGGGSGVTYAIVMSAMGNVPDAGNPEKQGKQIGYKVYILHVSQWDENAGFPDRINQTRGTIPLLSGEKWHYIGTVDDSQEAKFNAELGDVASAITNELTCIVGGISEKTRQLLNDGFGEKFFIVVETSYNDRKFIAGDKHKPMRLKTMDGGIKKDWTGAEITFGNETLSIWDEYVGALVTNDPVTVAADETTVALTPGVDQYKLSSGTSSAANITAFTGMTVANHLDIVELVGMGGDYPPTIDDDDDFILEDGATWTAAAGARISFKIFKDGASTYKFIEVPGSRHE